MMTLRFNIHIHLLTVLFLGIAWSGVSEETGKRRVADADKMPQILIPGGAFMMGTRDDDAFGRVAEYPPHKVELDPYWIDEHEVTNRQYCAFLNAAAKGDLARIYRFIDLGKEVCGIRYDRKTGTCIPRSGFADRPVCGVSWYGARDYATFVGRRLPTEAEWEKAARGTDERRYPWGNEFNPKLTATSENRSRKPEEVGHSRGDRSPYGVLDMAGNVAEWVEDAWQEDFYMSSPPKNPVSHGSSSRGVTRGGAWCLTEWDCRTTSRRQLILSTQRRYMGFRCAESAPVPLPPPAQVSNDVSFYAPMDEVVYATAAKGERHPQQVHGDIRFVEGKRGKAALLGEDAGGRCWVDYRTADNIDLSTGTISFWFLPLNWKGTDEGFRFFFMMRDPALAKFYIYRFVSGNLMVLAGNGVEGEWQVVAVGTDSWETGAWQHVAVTWTDNTLLLYVNSKKIGARKLPEPQRFRGLPAVFSVGQSQGWDHETSVRGQTAIDEFVIFNRALSPEEIVTEMQRGVNP